MKRIHDLLLGLVLGESNFGMNKGELYDIAAYWSVLCWLLGYGGNPVFEHNLRELERRMAAAFQPGLTVQ